MGGLNDIDDKTEMYQVDPIVKDIDVDNKSHQDHTSDGVKVVKVVPGKPRVVKMEEDNMKKTEQAKKFDKEKAKKEKLENDEKRRIENQRKADAKKERKERERELKLADEEQQKILKEKWYQQEKEKSDKKPKTIKEFKKLNDITNPEEKDEFDTLKKKQTSEHQQVLKQRWVEYEDDKKFYKNAKKQEKASKNKEEIQNLTRDEVIEVSKDAKVIEKNVISSI